MNREQFYKNSYFKLDTENRTPRIKKTVESFRKYGVKNFLDIGCGDGRLALFIGQECGIEKENIRGIDISYDAARLASENGIRSSVVDIDSYDFPCVKSCFDAVFCGEIIEHLFDPDHLLREVWKILKPNGIVVITTPNLASWFNRFFLLFGYQPYYADVSLKHYVGKFKTFENHAHAGGGHIRLFTHRALKELLILNDFEVLDASSTVGYNAESYSRVLNFMEKSMSRFPTLGSSLFFVARKSNR